MNVGLYQVIQIMGKHVIVDGVMYPTRLMLTQEDNKPYYLIELDVSDEPICINGYQLKSHHLTVFSSQSPFEGFASAYHYTGIFENNQRESVTLRQYYDRKDDHARTPDAWRNLQQKQSKSKKAAKAKLPDFFSDKETSQFFQSFVFNEITPIIKMLRAKQNNLLEKLEGRYKHYEKEMTVLSNIAGKYPGDWAASNRQSFLALTEQAISVLDEIEGLTNYPEEAQARKQFFVHYREKLTTNYQTVSTITEISDATMADTPSVVRIAPKPVNMTHPGLLDLLQQQKELEALVSSDNITADSIEAAREMLEQKFLKANGFSIPEATQFSIVGSLLDAKKRLADYAIELLFKGKASRAKNYIQYIMNVPNDLLLSCVFNNDVLVLETLYERGLLPIHTMLTDQENTALYELAAVENKDTCIQFFMKKGVPPVAIFGNEVAQCFQNNTFNTQRFIKLFQKTIRINGLLIGHLTSDDISDMSRNAMMFLNNVKKQYQRQHRKVDHAHQNNLLAIELLIEIHKMSDILIKKISSDKPFYNQLIQNKAAATTHLGYINKFFDAANLMSSFINITNLELNLFTPFLQPILTLLSGINRNLSKFNKPDDKQFLRLFKSLSDNSASASAFDVMGMFSKMRAAMNLKDFLETKLKLKTKDLKPLMDAFVEALGNAQANKAKNTVIEIIDDIEFSQTPLYEVQRDPLTGADSYLPVNQAASSALVSLSFYRAIGIPAENTHSDYESSVSSQILNGLPSANTLV